MDQNLVESMSSSKNSHWCTPPEVLDRVRKVNNIALDPCSNPMSIVDADLEIMPPQDGLTVPWLQDGGLTFVNPPYGREVKYWTAKARKEASKGAEIILLTAARVDTRWFHEDLFSGASAICFWKGRIKFIDPVTRKQGNPALFPSAVVYWGDNCLGFAKAFADAGYVMYPVYWVAGRPVISHEGEAVIV